MDIDRLSTGEKIAGLSAVLLFIFMFFDWFTVSASNGLVSVSVGGSAWDALDVIPIVLMVAIVAAVGVAVIRLTDALFEPAIPVNAVVTILGSIAVVLILYRIFAPPESGFVGVSVDPAVGIFLSLVAAIGIAVGGYKGLREEGADFGELGERFGGGSGGHQPPPSTPPPPPPPPQQGS